MVMIWTPHCLNLGHYLEQTLGIAVSPIPWTGSMRLPFFFKNRYDFFEVQLLETPCLLMLDCDEPEQTPAIIRKHIDQVQARWDGEVVYVRARVSAHNRSRLIKNKVFFIVPGSQMFLPMLGIDLREHFKNLRTEVQHFSPSTQAMVIYMLLRATSQRRFTPAEMAQCLGYSAMTMTRTFNELETAGLGHIFSEGRKRIIEFPTSAADIWSQAEPFLCSPVKKCFQISPPAVDLPYPSAGLTALAHYTELAEPANPVIALSSKDWDTMRQLKNVNILPFEEPGAVEIEVWSYAPSLFANDKLVDRLSLYLSLKENMDERVKAALAKMLKELPW